MTPATVPHPIPYQGSKRRLAARILARAPRGFDRLIEPFAGSAAVTLAAASAGQGQRYLLGERLAPLAALWQRILARPAAVASAYAALWADQRRDPRAHYEEVRRRFNASGEPELLLYLLARCVKSAVRFNRRGEFNQGADHRRRGAQPARMRGALVAASQLLAGRTTVRCADYRELLAGAGPRDLVYLDPPYQGVSGARDRRYVAPLDRDGFIAELARLGRAGVPYLVSFDGRLGDRCYGTALPRSLQLARVELAAGRSSQATLAGRDEHTIESLYLSPALR